MTNSMRVLMVQYAGDYREAVNRLSNGGPETYYAQRYSVDSVAEIGRKVDEMAILACVTDEPYNEIVANGVRAIGGGFKSDIPAKELIKLVEQQKPTHLIVGVPMRELLQWAIRNKVRTIALLADSFQNQSIKDRLKNYLLSNLLNNKQIEWVANHNINSSRSLQAIGVNPDKIVPWDWKPAVTPDSFSPKQLRRDAASFQLLYVGVLGESKGVGDVLEGVAKLKANGLSVKLKLAGKGDRDRFIAQAKQLGIEDQVDFLGLVPNYKIVHLMHESDVVIIPSRHDYPEGLPMTIYEALCSHTPIVASDHPMFQGKLVDDSNALIFPAGNSSVLAAQITKLLSNPDLYQQLSIHSKDAWKQLQIPVKFADLLHRWVFDSPENRQWLYDHRLASGRY